MTRSCHRASGCQTEPMTDHPEQPNPTSAPPAPDRRWFDRLPGGLIAFLAGVLLVGVTQIAFGGLIGIDGLYHLRLGAMYLSGEVQAVGGDFHWATHSIWNGNFADKEWLFHVLIAPFAWIAGAEPDSLIRAGMLLTALLAGLISLAAYRVFRTNGLRWPLFWVLLMLTASETFLFRVSLCRSYLLSILLALIGWQVISMAGRRRVGLVLVVLATIYTLAYTAPHLLLVLALVWAGVNIAARILASDDSERPWGQELRQAFSPALWVTLGIAIGAVLHPHTANLLSSWLVQNLAVPLRAAGADAAADWFVQLAGYQGGDSARVIDLGAELNSPTGRRLITVHGIAILLMTLPWVLAALTRPLLSRIDAYAWCCAAGFMLAMLYSERFTEYFTPFAVLAGGLLISKCLATPAAAEWLATRRRLATALPVMLLLALAIILLARPIMLHRLLVQDTRHPGLLGEKLGPEFNGDSDSDRIDPQAGANSEQIGTADNRLDPPKNNSKHAALMLKRHVPAGAVVFHAEWDMFAPLFFYAPEYRYINGLDPSFMAAKSPELYRLYRELADGEPTTRWKGQTAATIIRTEFSAEYALIDNQRNPELAKLLQRSELSGAAKLLERTPDRRWRLYQLLK